MNPNAVITNRQVSAEAHLITRQSDSRVALINSAIRVHCMLLAGLLGLLLSTTAMAEDSVRHYRIPAQSLNNALMKFAADAHLELMFTADKVRDLKSNGLDGTMTPSQALSHLLQGSGMTYRFVDAKTVTVEAPDGNFRKTAVTNETTEPQSNGSDTTLPKVTVEADATNPYDDPVWANDPYNTDYNRLNSSTATKTDTPIFDTPVSVQVVPRAVMDDQKSTRIKDVLENVSGVRAMPTLGRGNIFIVRGFSNGRFYRDGMLTNGNLYQGFPTEFDTGNAQSVDVLKGPAAVLYGRIEPGGLINITTKKPLETPYYSFEQQFGSYDFYRTQWDATGAITDDKSLLYRFTGAYQNNNSFRDFAFTDRVMVNPSITWRPTDKTDLTLSVEGFDQDFFADFGVPAIGNRPAPIPISRSLDDPNSPTDTMSKALISTEINHRFNDDWAIHNRFLANFNDEYSTFTNPAPAFGPSEEALLPDGTLRRNIFGQESDNESYAANLDVTGKFDLGFSKHNVLVGFDLFKSKQHYHYFGQYIAPNPALDINIFNPSYGISPALINQTLAQRPTGDTTNFAVSFSDWYGIYFQDHITLWDKLHIMGGGRYDWAETGQSYQLSYKNAEAALTSNQDEGFSPRVGILYQPIKELGIYGNWTTSFNANNAPSSDGSTFDPQRGEQFEGGLKTQLFDSRLLATLAYYYLVKDNILVPDLTTANPFDRVSNKQRSQGIEFDVTGQITDNFSLIASYAYTDAKVKVDHNGGTAGNRMPNVPDHAGSLWLKYDMKGFDAKDGFSFGLGGVAAGARQGDFANSFQMPGFVRMDAFAAYKMNVAGVKVTTQFNIRNLLDKTYYESTDPDQNVTPRLGIAPGAPLTAIGSIRVEY
jgi:iron complex outermembrane recepter protein